MSEVAEQVPTPSPYVQAALDCYHAHFGKAACLDREVVGFYGSAVLLQGVAGVSDAVVVKLSKQPGRVAREIVGLDRLRADCQVAIPQVLASGTTHIGYPIEYLMLNRLPGVAPWDVAKPWANPKQTAQQVVDVLLGWHAVSDARGFELPDGKFTAELLTAFEAWTQPLHDYVQSPASPFTPQQKAAYELLWQERSRLLAPLAGMPSSLVHDDPHAGNFLFDENTGELLAVLDPCDVAFRHREQDIFHLADVAPELQLLETYLQHYTAPEGFAARRWFFSLWDDAKHSRNMTWYDEKWFDDKLINFARTDKAFADAVNGGILMLIDFGKTAQDYRQHRSGFPEAFFVRAAAVGVGLAGQQILDIGTGTGTLARGFALRGADVIGLDPAVPLLEQARSLDQQAGVEVTYQQGKAESLPFADCCFDVVSAGQCWHWFDRAKAAQEAYRVLRRGGVMAMAHFDWLPLPGNAVEATEQLILQHNPGWQGAAGTGIHAGHFADLTQAGFVGIEALAFDSPVLYSHEAWRGRIRASAGVAASLSSEAVVQFDQALAAILARDFSGDPLFIPHRVFMVYARKY